MAKVGDLIILDFQLHDFSTDKHVKAIIEADGVETTYSPILVPHVGDGKHLYVNPLITFPSNTFLIAITFEVYSDAGLTNRLKRYGAARDQYELSSGSSGVSSTSLNDTLNSINKAIDEFKAMDSNIIVSIAEDTDEVSIYVSEEDEITVEVIEEEIEIEVSDSMDEISIYTEEEEISINVNNGV